MRKSLYGTVALAVIAASASANAADFPLRAPAYMPPPVTNWTGCYLGTNSGSSFSRSNINYAQGPSTGFGAPPSTAAVGFAESNNLNTTGYIGGGQVNCNFQISNWVVGAETDLAWRKNTGTFTRILNGASDYYSETNEQKWLGTVRGRLGLAVDNFLFGSNYLFYVTGGLAYGRVYHALTQASLGPVSGRTLEDSAVKAGWTVGVGVEQAITPKWSLGFEYLYVNLGSNDYGLSAATINTLAYPATTAHFEDTSHLIRGKINYKLDWSPGR